MSKIQPTHPTQASNLPSPFTSCTNDPPFKNTSNKKKGGNRKTRKPHGKGAILRNLYKARAPPFFSAHRGNGEVRGVNAHFQKGAHENKLTLAFFSFGSCQWLMPSLCPFIWVGWAGQKALTRRKTAHTAGYTTPFLSACAGASARAERRACNFEH